MPATWNANVGYAPSDVTTEVPGSTCRRATTPNSASMPSPTTTCAGVTPCRAAIACLRSWFSGSPYIQPSAAAACIAAIARGAAPNALSLAPSRARKGRARRRSSASGPTNGHARGQALDDRGQRCGHGSAAVLLDERHVAMADRSAGDGRNRRERVEVEAHAR